MEKRKQINTLLQNSKLLGNIDMDELNEWTLQYPYFQSLQCIYLKKLYIKESFQYNLQLRKTAALTSNREVLFDFITSKEFAQQEVAQQIQYLQNQEEKDELDFGLTAHEAEEISKPDLFVPKPKTGKPVSFSKDEKYSFEEWLQLMHLNPIEREKEKTTTEAEKTPQNSVSSPKMDKVDFFLKNNPRIKPIKDYAPKKEIKLKTAPSSQLMTETLARVYEEQKAYEKAIQAYKILILNNPEKNSFFAIQIERLEQLLENNTK